MHNSTSTTTTHTYASGSSTSFTVQTSGGGGGGTPTEAPQAHAGGPYTGVVGTLIQFNGSKSTATSGTTISSYSWIFGDGTTAVGVKPTHTYITAGTYTVQLTVTDNTGATDTASTTATISSIAPPAATDNSHPIKHYRQSTVPLAFTSKHNSTPATPTATASWMSLPIQTIS